MASKQESDSSVDFFYDAFVGRNPPEVIAAIRSLNERILLGEDPQAIEIPRGLFAPSSWGQKIYDLIIAGLPCEILGEDQATRCERTSIAVLDFDIPIIADPEILPVCSFEHLLEGRQRLTESGDKFKKYMLFGVNGWGRGSIVGRNAPRDAA